MVFAIRAPPNAAGKSWPAIAVGLFVAFGGILFGYDTGTIGDILAMPYFIEHFSTGNKDATGAPVITAAQQSEIVSILSAGTFFGALTAAFTCDIFGRRGGLMTAVVVFTLGVILQTAAVDIPVFVAGRFFAGFGVGLISASIPLYQSETAPKWIRGSVVGAYQFAITIGILLANIVGNSTTNRNDTGSYRIPIAVQFAWAIIMMAGLFLLPDTPRYYIKKNRPEKAAKALSTLRRLDVDHPALVEELAEITANHEFELTLGKASWLDCFKGNLGKRLATGCLLQALQQLTGVNFIFYYGPTFFKASGIGNPFITSIITGVINVVSTVPGLYLVEAWGRRPLLLTGAIGMFVCQFIVAGVGLAGNALPTQRALIAFVCIYIAFFASSWGPCAWVVCGEIYPLKIRSKGLAMSTASNWLLNWAIAYATPYLVNKGPGNAGLLSNIFWIWGGCCVLCAIFVYLMIYETKGLSLEQVDELYAKVHKAWKSPGFVPTVSFVQVQDSEKHGNHVGGNLGGLESEKRDAVHNEGVVNDKNYA